MQYHEEVLILCTILCRKIFLRGTAREVTFSQAYTYAHKSRTQLQFNNNTILKKHIIF